MADSIDPEITAHVAALAGAARLASRRLGLLTRADKDQALLGMADALDSASAEIIAANDEDIARGRAEGLAEGLVLRQDPRPVPVRWPRRWRRCSPRTPSQGHRPCPGAPEP